MELKKDITLDNICSISTDFLLLSKDVIFGNEDGIEPGMRNLCWQMVENFVNLTTYSDISYKHTLMCNMWDTIYGFINSYIRNDHFLPRRRTAVTIYEIMKPIEEARTIKKE